MASIAGHKGGDIDFKFDKRDVERMITNMGVISADIRKKAVRKGVTAGGKVIRASMKESAPPNKDSSDRQRGLLKRSISVRNKTYKRSQLFYSIIGAKWIDQKKNPAKYIHILETGGQKYSRGLNPFARDAFKRKENAAARATINTMKFEFERIRGRR